MTEYKYYNPDLSLSSAQALLSDLHRDKNLILYTYKSTYEMKSEAQAEARGIYRWQNYNPLLNCNKPKHHARGTFIKTPLGWMQLCCAKELGLEQIPNTYIEPTPEEIEARYSERELELQKIVEKKQAIAISKMLATKAIQAEKAKIAKALAKASRTPEEILAKKIAREQKKLEKEALLPPTL